MRSIAVLTITMMALAGAAGAQTTGAAAGEPMKGYVEGFAQSAFGNVTSQAFGAEGGFAVGHNLVVFVEGGKIRDVATSDLGAAAQKIAGFLSSTQSGAVTYGVKEPVTFFDAGVKYMIPVQSKVMPYVMGGVGIANVSQNVTFSVGGVDVTNNMASVGVTLGSDLSGDFTKPMVVGGGGVLWPVWQQLVVDVQLRVGRIMAEDQGITASRAGIGLGLKF